MTLRYTSLKSDSESTLYLTIDCMEKEKEMDKQAIFDVITGHVREVVPGLSAHSFVHDDALRDLGANSLDRSEIIMMTLESLSLRIPLVETAGASNLGELAGVLHEKLQCA